MGSINFPLSPTDGQTYTAGLKTWKYVAAKKVWDLTSTPETFADEIRTTVADTAPTSGRAGREWINPATLKRYVRIQDASGDWQLVEAAGFYYVDDAVAIKQSQDAASAAAGSATSAAGSATTAGNAASTATQQALIVAAASRIFATTTAGIAGTSTDQYFYVPSTNALGSYDVWLNNAGVAQSAGITLPSLAAVQQNFIGAGEIFGTAAYVLNSGGVAGGTVTTATSLLSIPAASTGAGSFLVGNTAPSAAQIAALVGCTIRLSVKFTATANFITDKAPNTNFMGQVQRSTGLVSLTATNTVASSRRQVGTELFVDVDYVVTSTDQNFGAGYQVIGTAVANSLHTLQVASVSWRIIALPAGSGLPTNQDRMVDQRLMTWWDGKGGDALLARHFTWGDVLTDCTMAPQYAGGAVARNNNAGRAVGFTIPTGSTGVNTILQPKLTFDGATYTGRTVKVTWGFDTSANFSRALTVTFQLNRAAGAVNRAATVTNVQTGSRRVITATYTLQGDETVLQPYIIITGAGAAVADEFMLQTSFALEITASTSDVKTPLDETLEFFRARTLTDALTAATDMVTTVSTGLPSTTLQVETVGGDYTTVAAAVAALTTVSANKRGQVSVGKGTFTVTEVAMGSYKDLAGVGRRDSMLQLFQADNTALATITANSGLRVTGSTAIRDVMIEVKNARYAIHDEGNNANPDAVHVVENVSLRHYGNAGARTYQQGIGTPAGTNGSYGVWASTAAFGLGLASGVSVALRDSVLISDESYPLSFHDNLDWARAAKIRVERCQLSTLSTTTAVGAIFAQSFGSGRESIVELQGCSLNGDIVTYADTGWMPTTLDKQPANHQGFRIVGYGNTPAMFWTSDFGRALRIDSATTGASSRIQISGGTAYDVLFGPNVYKVDGAVGVTGYSYGWADVSGGVTGTSLGARLGNCTGTNKTLQLSVDGGSLTTITFVEDYTAMDNTTVLGKINTLLGAGAVASLFAVGERVRPFMQDEEQVLKNSSAESILMGMALAYDQDDRTVRKMLSTDPVSRYAGQAWQDIYPGQQGRVKCKGYVALGRNDTIRDDSAAITVFNTFSISATNPGRIVVGGSQGLLQVVRAAIVDRNAVLKVR